MNSNKFTTPIIPPARLRSSVKPTAAKRDSLVAELERGAHHFVLICGAVVLHVLMNASVSMQFGPPDPQLSTAKRQQRTQAFTSTMAHASLERQLVAAQTTKMELESKLREKDMAIESLEEDRRWLAEREKEEREEKEKGQAEREEEQVRVTRLCSFFVRRADSTRT